MSAVLSGLCWACVIGGTVALCIIARSYWNQAKDYRRTPPTAIAREPAQARVAGLTEISFAAPGIPTLAAWYAPPVATRAAIVLIHGVSAERSALLFELRTFARAGFAVLALDLPGQGASGGRSQWADPERRAISAAVDWLSARAEIDPRRIGAFGMSMGAYVLAQAAVLDTRIGAVTLVASPHDVVEFNRIATRRWGILSQWPTYWALRAGGTPLDMRPKDIVREIAPRPVLIVIGDQDELVLPWMSRQIYDAAREPKELYIVRGAHHCDHSIVAPVEYARRLVEFNRRALLG